MKTPVAAEPAMSFSISQKSNDAIDALFQATIHVTQLSVVEVETKDQQDELTAAYEAVQLRRRELYERVQYLEVPHRIATRVLKKF